jgi:hypothetical protein
MEPIIVQKGKVSKGDASKDELFLISTERDWLLIGPGETLLRLMRSNQVTKVVATYTSHLLSQARCYISRASRVVQRATRGFGGEGSPDE